MDKIDVLSKCNRLLDLSPNYHIYDTKRTVSMTKIVCAPSASW